MFLAFSSNDGRLVSGATNGNKRGKPLICFLILKTKKLVGLDIGSHSVKLLQASNGGVTPRLLNMGIALCRARHLSREGWPNPRSSPTPYARSQPI